MFTLNIFLADRFDCSNLKENILNDYEIIKSIFLDDFEEIDYEDNDFLNEQSNKISFKLNLKLELEGDSTLIELIEVLKFSDLLINSSTIRLPYWIKFSCDISNQLLEIKFYLFWVKKFSQFLDEVKENISNNLNQESLFFGIVEILKNMIPQPDKKTLINWLQQMKEELVIQKGEISIDKIIYNNHKENNINLQNNHNTDIYDYECDNMSLLKARSSKILENSKNKQEKNQIQNLNQFINKNVFDIEDQYEQFLIDGGFVGEIISDRGSTFQAHGIRITCFNDVNKYLKILKTNNKIFKATHNILAYRISQNNKSKEEKGKIIGKGKKNTSFSEGDNLTQGFDDDGEDGAGIRLLGILEKMKICNFMVVISRWFGGTLLGNDRFKHINDAAKNLINKYKNNLEFLN